MLVAVAVALTEDETEPELVTVVVTELLGELLAELVAEPLLLTLPEDERVSEDELLIEGEEEAECVK